VNGTPSGKVLGHWLHQSRAITTLAVPLILTNFAYVALTTTDIVMLGRLSASDIAAAGLAIVLFNQFRTTGTGLVTGVSNLVAEARARNDHARVRALLVAGLFWATASGVAFAVALMSLTPLLVLLGQGPEVVAKTQAFLLIMAPGMLPCLWFQMLRHFTVGLKQPGPLLGITVVSIGMTIALNYALIYGRLGLPALGYLGVAYATTTVFLLSFLMFLLAVVRNRKIGRYFSRSGLGWPGEAVTAVWRLGLPIAGTYASEAGFFSVLTLLIGTLGADALAAQTVLNQIVYIVFMISAGISHAASIHISEAYGAADHTKARRLGLLGLALGVAAMLIIAVPYALVPEAIVSLFVPHAHQDNAAVLALATSGLLIAVVLQIFDAGQNIGNGILRGVGDTSGPFRISLVGYWLIGLPASYLLGLTAGYGVRGVWIGQTIGLAATAAALTIAFLMRTDGLRKRALAGDAAGSGLS
jgi:MATE family, multidrug efflux pump